MLLACCNHEICLNKYVRLGFNRQQKLAKLLGQRDGHCQWQPGNIKTSSPYLILSIIHKSVKSGQMCLNRRPRVQTKQSADFSLQSIRPPTPTHQYTGAGVTTNRAGGEKIHLFPILYNYHHVTYINKTVSYSNFKVFNMQSLLQSSTQSQGSSIVIYEHRILSSLSAVSGGIF